MNTQREVLKREPGTPERVQQRRTVAPLVDIYENVDEVLMLADMPGVRQEDVNVRFEKNQLTLEGHYAPAAENEHDHGFLYSRTFALPGGIDADRIAAELKNGVLKVHLPKHDTLKPRQIAVKGA